MIVLLILFGEYCSLLESLEKTRNTLASNIVNLVLRLFTESREFFAMVLNGKDLDSNNLPFTNLTSTSVIIANFQHIRGDDLPLALMPSKHNTRKEPGGFFSRNEQHMGH